MATGDRVKDAVKLVLAAQKAEKRKGQELEAFVTYRKASDSCANLLARGASDKQRSVLEKNAAKFTRMTKPSSCRTTPSI